MGEKGRKGGGLHASEAKPSRSRGQLRRRPGQALLDSSAISGSYLSPRLSSEIPGGSRDTPRGRPIDMAGPSWGSPRTRQGPRQRGVGCPLGGRRRYQPTVPPIDHRAPAGERGRTRDVATSVPRREEAGSRAAERRARLEHEDMALEDERSHFLYQVATGRGEHGQAEDEEHGARNKAGREGSRTGPGGGAGRRRGRGEGKEQTEDVIPGPAPPRRGEKARAQWC